MARALPDEKFLVFWYYKGHASEQNDLLTAIGAWGAFFDMENFLYELAKEPNVYVMALFDCCRGDMGRGGMHITLNETKNICCMYRADSTSYDEEVCTCEVPYPNVAKEFLDHLKGKMQERIDD